MGIVQPHNMRAMRCCLFPRTWRPAKSLRDVKCGLLSADSLPTSSFHMMMGACKVSAVMRDAVWGVCGCVEQAQGLDQGCMQMWWSRSILRWCIRTRWGALSISTVYVSTVFVLCIYLFPLKLHKIQHIASITLHLMKPPQTQPNA